MTVRNLWQEIRALRATPTGEAAADKRRRRTFVASLQQAEELAAAANSVSYAARPILLFYCLSQAGRAIAAARKQHNGDLRGHGLRVSVGNKRDVLTTRIAPEEGDNSFSGVASAVGSPGLEGAVCLGDVWAANPDLRDIPIPNVSDRKWARALTVRLGVQGDPSIPDPETCQVRTNGLIIAQPDIRADTGAELEDELEDELGLYPTLRGAFGLKNAERGVERAESDDNINQWIGEDGNSYAVIARCAPKLITHADNWRRQREWASIIEKDEGRSTPLSPYLVGYALPKLVARV